MRKKATKESISRRKNIGLGAGLLGLGALATTSLLKKPKEGEAGMAIPPNNMVHPWPPQDKMEVPQDTLGPDGFTKQWTNAQGYKIFSVFYPTTVKKPKGILLLLHGHGVHVIFEFMKSSGVGVERKYDKSWIQELNKQGYSCCGMDVQSKGRSEGYKQMRTYFDSFDDVIKDDLDFISKLPELGGKAFTDLPIFPFAVSMGGARAAMLLIRNESLFKAALLYAPMLSLERVSKQGLNPYLRPLVSMFNILGPTWRMAKASKNTMFPDLQDEFSSDFFSDQGMTRVRVASEYLRVTTEIMQNLDQITLPFVTFHSDGDDMVDPEGSRQLVAKASSKIKRYENCPGSWHILIQEPGNDVTLQKTIDFLNEVNP